MIYKDLTQKHFEEFKNDYSVYGTHIETDKYNNERNVVDTEPKATIHVMWQPVTDYASVVEYGRDVARMFYCILYEEVNMDYDDIVIIRGDEYEVVGMKLFNTYTRVEVRKKV